MGFPSDLPNVVVGFQAAISRFVAEANDDPKPFTWLADPNKSPSVPMMVRHRSPESLASHGRRTIITWSCKIEMRKRTVPPELVRREAAGRPQCRLRRRRRPNCRIGRGVGLLRRRRC